MFVLLVKALEKKFVGKNKIFKKNKLFREVFPNWGII